MDDLKNPLLPPSRPVTAPPPTSFALAKKRITNLPKKTPFRSWIRVEASTGATSCVSLDKVTLMRRCDLPARDLRLLDPLFLYPSTILGREKAIVVNLEKIRCIITADELLVSVQSLNGNAGGGEEWEYAEEVQRRHASRSDDLPFEFVALEVALETTSAYLDAQATDLEIEAYPLLDELTSKISTLNLERVRRLKSKLVALTRRVQKVRDEIEQLMDDDGDMAELYLTEKRHSIESFYTEHGTLGGPGMSASAPTSPFGSPTSTSAGLKKLERNFSLARSSRHGSSRSVETEKRDIEEIEMLLEAYFVVVDNTLNKLMSLKEYIDDTEDFINIKLDNVRNQLIQFELLLTTATFIVAIFGVIAGIFGMNFEISLFDVPEAFNWVLGISGMAGIIIFSGFFWCFKRRRLIPL
ncbi:magnesium transporter MRS2-1-like isoform X1 [Carex littledalei]|uniref:Magnesium transporter n=1 Tax=Carex littledalei TaxID=544730 RepID=A0A833VWM7_9POAL|nr:magnesium transporter MRS2-1-like isoform X1 [Carex littledalei]